MDVRIFASHADHVERRNGAAAHALGRVLDTAARVFKRRPDDRLVNVKFTDALERELLARAFKGRPLLR